MRKYFSFITIAAALFMGHGCIKDELTAAEIDEGSIKDLPTTERVVTSKHICVRQKVLLDVDSLLDSGAFPLFNHDICECDTLDIRIGKMPDELKLIGFVKEGSRAAEPSKKRLGIITNWRGVLYFEQDGLPFPIPVSVNLSKCD